MSESPEQVAKELENTESGELDEKGLEEASGGTAKEEEIVINGNCGC